MIILFAIALLLEKIERLPHRVIAWAMCSR